MKCLFSVNLIVIAIVLYAAISVAGIEEFCADKWPNDYNMRQYCTDQQIDGNSKLFSIARKEGLVKGGSLSASTSGSDKESIISRCMDKWEVARFNTYDFNMVVYCIEQQFEAYDKTTDGNESTTNTGIKGFCADKWPSDYRMRDYCQDQQVEGNAELFRIAESYGLVSNGRLSTTPNGSTAERIINRCMTQWELTKFETYDFRMVVYCMKKSL